MNQQNHKTVLELRSKITIKEEEIKLKELELSSLRKDLFDVEWVRFSWKQLEEWLKANRPLNNYHENPIVTNGHHQSYCYINSKEELEIGGYYHNDRFPRGKDIYVAYDFKNWR
jgi:hypothetical protein